MALPTVKIKFEVDPAAAKRGLADIQTALKATDAATKKYEKDLIGLKRAQDSGLLSLKKYDAELKKLTADYLKTSQAAATLAGATAKVESPTKKATGAFGKLATISSKTRFQLQNVAFQLQDIIVQIQGGQGVTRALSQQLPQLAGGFGFVGAAIGVFAGLAIPAIAAVVTQLDLFGDETLNVEDAVDALDSAMSDIKGSMKILSLTAEELADKFGLAGQQIRAFALDALELQISQATDRMQEQVEVLGELTKGYRNADASTRQGRGARAQISKDFGVNALQAIRLAAALDDLRKAVGPDLQAEGLQNIFDLLDKMGVPLADIPPDLRAAILEMITLNTKTAELEELMRKAGLAAATIPAALAAGAGGAGRGRGAGPQGITTDIERQIVTLFGTETIESKEDAKLRTGGGGRAKTDPAEAKLEALIKSLQTEQETIEMFRVEGLALLASASETELAALGGINEAKLRIEKEYQDRLRGIKVTADRSNLGMTLSAGTQLLGALGQFNDKALKLSKVFGIAEALVSTYKGAAKALELPFPANLFAMATVIATGLSQVAAIRGVSKGGGGGGGASAAAVSAPAVAAAAPAAAGPAQTPLNVRLSGLGINDFISGGQLSSLFDSLQDEAGDRGLNVSFAT